MTVIPLAFLLALVSHGDMPWWSLVGLGIFFLAGSVFLARSVRSYVSVKGNELMARCTLYPPVRCKVAEITRLYLSNETVIFGMTRPWMLWIELMRGPRRCASDDVKRFSGLGIFLLADTLGRRLEGPATPYLALVTCQSKQGATERGRASAADTWVLIKKLIADGATVKILLKSPTQERWIFLIGGRYLRLEETYPRDLSPDMVDSAVQAYEFQRSGLQPEEVTMVLRTVEPKWLGAA